MDEATTEGVDSVGGRKPVTTEQKMGCLLGVVLLMGLCWVTFSDKPATPTGGEMSISKSIIGDKWPLTVDSGTVSCSYTSSGGKVVTFTANGTRYGVNGTALSQGLPKIDPIWINTTGDEAKIAPKKNIGPILDLGLTLCK